MACKQTYWQLNDQEEWVEIPCPVLGRHSTHQAGINTHYGAAASRWTREEMERSEAKSTARERRLAKAQDDEASYSRLLADAQGKVTYFTELLAGAQQRVRENES